MDFHEKKKIVLQNRQLSPGELSSRTGLSPREIQKILEKNPVGEAPAPQARPTESARPWAYWGAALLPSLLAFLAYLPSLGNQLLNWDDILYILRNPHIRRLDIPSIQWMFTHFYAGLWIPLTWVSLALDYRLGKLDPRFYHLDNLMLHAVNTALVFFLSVRILRLAGESRSGGGEGGPKARVVWAAFLTALFFGLNPLRVESVAWATERKDLLYGLFYLLGLLAYLDYATPPPNRGESKVWRLGPWKLHRKMALVLFLYLLSILSKPMAAPFPLVLLILDFWPLGRLQGRLGGVLLEKIPLFVLAAFSGWVTVVAQASVGSIAGLSLIPLSYRVMNACHSLAFYLVKMAVPIHLAAFYPIDLRKTYSPAYVYSTLACALVVLALLFYRRQRPYLAAAGVYYLVSLAPVLGFVQSGSQCAADRFTYLPSLAPSLLLGAALTALFSRWGWMMPPLAAALAALMGLGTLRQTQTWSDNITLWRNVLDVNPRNSPVAHANLADGLMRIGRLQEALVEFDAAIRVGPAHSFAHDGRGYTLLQLGRTEEAVGEMKKAIALDPDNAEFLCHLGMAYARLGKPRDAQEQYRLSLQADPYWVETYYQAGLLYRDQGEGAKAQEALRKAVDLDPDNASYQSGLKSALQEGK